VADKTGAGGRARGTVKRDQFKFIVSPVTTFGVDVDILYRLADGVASLSRGEGFEKELSAVVVFPIVTDTTMYRQRDFVTNKRKDRAFYVGKNIEHELWMRARKVGRLKLAVDNFQESILSIPDQHLSSGAKARLMQLVRVASKQMP
jgi:hypothetical protein